MPPLPLSNRAGSPGWPTIQENSALQFALTIDELSDQEKETIEIVTSTGDSQPYVRWGTISFQVEGETATLTVYRDENDGEFFLPFTDLTSRQSSYGEGRYVDLEPLHHGRFRLDFNYAYNPYCAYNANWSCPVPPVEDRLDVAIEAGEKSFPDAEGH